MISDTRIAAVLSADVADLNRLQSDSPESAARATAQLKEAFVALTGKHGGAAAETIGNVFRATFITVGGAVTAAIALQDALDERNKGLGQSEQVDVRAGVALADALRGFGEPSDVFISDAIYEQARGVAAATFAADGTRTVAG